MRNVCLEKDEELELAKRAYKLFRRRGYKRGFKNFMAEIKRFRQTRLENLLRMIAEKKLFHNL